jgi:hypothetical protein
MHPSPLPPDPVSLASGSPLPPDPVLLAEPSDLPGPTQAPGPHKLPVRRAAARG